MELYLIRHGEMQGDPHQHYQPPVQECLSELGCTQAAALGAALRQTKFDAIYSSPLGRAVQTAQAVAGNNLAAIQILPWLIEWRPATVLGTCQEADYAAVEASTAKLRPEQCWKTAAGEGTLEMAHRVIVGFQQLMADHGVHPGHGGYLLDDPADKQRLALVAHGGSLSSLASFLLGIPIKPFGAVAFAYTGVAVFHFVRRIDVWYPTLLVPSLASI